MAKNKKGARECFVARPGYAIVSVDMDSFEMRTWAWICGMLFGFSSCVLPGILNDRNRCPHVEMGHSIYEAQRTNDYGDLAQAYLLKGKDKKALRGLAKGPNFGLPGGMGAARLLAYCWVNYRVPIPLEDEPEKNKVGAKSICRIWREVYPEAQPYLDTVSEDIGRKRGSRGQIQQWVSKRLRGNVGFTDAANGYFQALAADIAKRAGYLIAREAYNDPHSPLYGCFPLAFVHDEWLYEVPVHKIHEAGMRIAEIMTAVAHEYCPDVLFTAAPAAMYTWSKEAGDPMFVLGGKTFVGGAGAKVDIHAANGQLLNDDGNARLIVYEEGLKLAA